MYISLKPAQEHWIYRFVSLQTLSAIYIHFKNIIGIGDSIPLLVKKMTRLITHPSE